MKFSMSATCCPVRPRRLPDGFKSTQDASRMAPRAPKTPLEWLQERPTHVPDGSRSAQDASQTAPGAPKTAPGVPKTPPGAPKTPPIRLQERLRRLPDGSRSAQDAPQSLQDTSKSFQDSSKRASGTTRGGPQRSPSACQDAFCSTRPAREHDLKTGLWTKLIQAYGQHHSTSLCSFCRVD